MGVHCTVVVMQLSICSLSDPVTLSERRRETVRNKGSGIGSGYERNRRPGPEIKTFNVGHCDALLSFSSAS